MAVEGEWIMEKKNKDIIIGVCILLIGIFIGSLIAVIVVESNAPSSASNDGWLSFLGGFIGSIITGLISFYILFVNRRDVFQSQVESIRKSEMDNMEKDLKDAFSLIRIGGSDNVECSNFLFILNKIDKKYQNTKYFNNIFKVYNYCLEDKRITALFFEAETYRAFLEYRKQYIEMG